MSQAIDGTIPARAGKPRAATLDPARLGDHPRAGGETVRRARERMSHKGPSPRGRGNPDAPEGHCRRSWTIPARAGKPATFMAKADVPPDHPRAGGETHPPRRRERGGRGPSPRGRGNQRRRDELAGVGGTIPARAGKPSTPSPYSENGADHPRAGGETSELLGQSMKGYGPSPRGRGNPSSSPLELSERGTIPARAGKPSRRCGVDRRTWDHPRAGGETGRPSASTSWTGGPSPRGRGNPERD